MTTGKQREHGFTLMELMIVIVIVAILLAVALPAYQNQIIRGHRAAAKSEMLDIANRQQQFLLSDRAYASKGTLAGTGYSLPEDVSDRYDYDIALNDPNDPPAFTITFTAKGAQLSDGDLTIDNQGVKLPTEKWER